MRFMVIVKGDEKSEAGVRPDPKAFEAMGKYNAELVKAGMWVAADGLKPSSAGARIRIQGKKTSVIDGPFAESKELIAGYWLLSAKSQTEMIEWLKRAPFSDAEIEVRPLFELEDFPVTEGEKPDGWRDQEQKFRDEAAAKGVVALNPRKAGTKRYLSFLKADKNTEAEMVPNEQLLTEMGNLMDEMLKSGVMLSGEGLKPSSAGARIKYSAGKATVIDGPFAETKELIAGYSLIQTKTKEEACEWARRCLQIHVSGTGIDSGEIEVREVYDLDDYPTSDNEVAGGGRDRERARQV